VLYLSEARWKESASVDITSATRLSMCNVHRFEGRWTCLERSAFLVPVRLAISTPRRPGSNNRRRRCRPPSLQKMAGG
jgi:hypothetical protein